MQTVTVGSFYSSEMIICIHNDNLLIPRHLICIHDFKKHFNNLSVGFTLLIYMGCMLDNIMLEKIH